MRERSERDSEPKSGNAEAFQSIKRSNQRHKALKLNSRFFFFGSLFLFSRPKKEKVNKVQTIRKVLFDKLKCHVRGDYTTRKAAFTLAEVLITLGIIGVVAAMTLPTLIQNYKVKQTVTQLKKINSQLSQAYTLIREEEGGGSLNSETFGWDDDLFMEKFAKYLKFQKKCPGNVGECWQGTMYKDVKGGDYSRYDGKGNSRASGILADGTFIMFNLRRVEETNSEGETEYIDKTPGDGMWAQIYADINGHKPPNQLGVDFFYWFIVGDRIYPGGVPSCGKYGCNPQKFITGCAKANGYDCTAWVIYNENMDYLKCDNLSWEGKHKCK